MTKLVFIVNSWEIEEYFGKPVVIFRGIGQLGAVEVFNVPVSQISISELEKIKSGTSIDRHTLKII